MNSSTITDLLKNRVFSIEAIGTSTRITIFGDECSGFWENVTKISKSFWVVRASELTASFNITIEEGGLYQELCNKLGLDPTIDQHKDILYANRL